MQIFKYRSLLITALLASSFVFGSASAGSNFYYGLSIGKSEVKITSKQKQPGSSKYVDRGTDKGEGRNLNFVLGYELASFLAVELRASKLGSLGRFGDNVSASNINVVKFLDDGMLSGQGLLRISLPITEDVKPYIAGGAGMYEHIKEPVLVGVLGLDLFGSPTTALTLELGVNYTPLEKRYGGLKTEIFTRNTSFGFTHYFGGHK